jgi:hypothetical protein
MEVGLRHFTPCPKSQVWHACLHGNTFGGETWDLCWGLHPTIATQVLRFFTWNNQDLTFMNVNHGVMVSWSSKVGTYWHEWNLELGILCKLALTYHAIDYVSWSTGYCIKPTSKMWVYNPKTRRPWHFQSLNTLDLLSKFFVQGPTSAWRLWHWLDSSIAHVSTQV